MSTFEEPGDSEGLITPAAKSCSVCYLTSSFTDMEPGDVCLKVAVSIRFALCFILSHSH